MCMCIITNEYNRNITSPSVPYLLIQKHKMKVYVSAIDNVMFLSYHSKYFMLKRMNTNNKNWWHSSQEYLCHFQLNFLKLTLNSISLGGGRFSWENFPGLLFAQSMVYIIFVNEKQVRWENREREWTKACLVRAICGMYLLPIACCLLLYVLYINTIHNT